MQEPQAQVAAERKKQYAAELEAQVRQAAERKKAEKAQSIAETRQLLVQAGEIEPDHPPYGAPSPHGGPGGMVRTPPPPPQPPRPCLNLSIPHLYPCRQALSATHVQACLCRSIPA